MQEKKDYPAIVDKESFLCVGSMKPPPIRKSCRKREMISDSAESFDFEYSECLEAMDMEREISEIIEKRKAGSTEVLGMILRLAEMKYSCVVQREEK